MYMFLTIFNIEMVLVIEMFSHRNDTFILEKYQDVDKPRAQNPGH